MKIAIIGASGLLGRSITHELKNFNEFQVIGTANNRVSADYHKLNILDKEATHSFLKKEMPNIIFYVAAEKTPAVCEADPFRAYSINVEPIKTIVETVGDKTWIVYISTDYVFDGNNAPYAPSAQTSPINEYGKSKHDAEQMLWSLTHNACVLRLPLLYGPVTHPLESIVTRLIKELRDDSIDKISADNWAIRYPTYTGDIAVVCRQLIQQKVKDQNFNGTFHWSTNEPYTKHQMGLKIAELLGVSNKSLVPEKEKSNVAKPYDCHLDCSALEALGIGKRTYFAEGIRRVIEQSGL